MTVTINLSPELEQVIRMCAARSGQDMSEFVLQAVKEKIAKARTFDEITTPFAEAVAATGVSDEDFDRFFNEVRDDFWQDKHGKST